jgi:hypothetical protein
MAISGPFELPLVAEWAWNARAVAVTWALRESPCRVQLRVLAEGNREALAHTYDAPACRFLPRVLATDIGSVLFRPDGALQLLGPGGEAIGDPLTIPLSVYADAWLDDSVATGTDGSSVVVLWQTESGELWGAVAGCADP